MSVTRESRWAPDPTLVAQTMQSIDALLAASGQVVADQAAIEAVAALGRLKRMGFGERAQAMAARWPDPAALAEHALGAFDFGGLEAAALAFLEAAPDLAEGDEADEGAVPRTLAALTMRDQVEQVLLGAEILLGRAPVLEDEPQSLLMEFDSLVRPELFRAVPLNDERAKALSAIAPEQRAGLWWFKQGVGLPSDALDALATAAELIAHFPEAAEELRDLIEAEETITGLAQPPGRLAQPLVLGEMGGQRATFGQPESSQTKESQQPALRVITQGTENGGGNRRR